ncbi:MULTISPECIES: hypothetical protein [Actinokineospora]|uniref:Uncharacterized protein n=1 Tax=Actinokineospora fastidiosa TaxID=1816 RepID=A0A918GD43_9PSEU|nr:MULTISPECIES: hypothetical protein [Actinokineospora]UVS79526.1 hypothetical protein Actkin_03276 [Actinokineospora sp. UTMC 2448]GGS29324.1 hypothetical protein GCM10010171_23250 [Actinokineospora fastidiosa]
MTTKAVALAVLGAGGVVLFVIGLTTGANGLVGLGVAVMLAVLVIASFTVRRSGAQDGPAEQDVASDDAVAGSRATGGADGPGTGDRGSTTGAGPSDTFVGRVAGDPESAAGQSGAEARAEDRRRGGTGS